MTDYPQGYNPPQPEPPYDPTRPVTYPPVQPTVVPKKRKVWPWIVGGLAVMVLLCCGIGVVGNLAGSDNDKNGAASTPTKPAPAAGKPALLPAGVPTTPPALTYPEPKASEWKIAVKVLEKKCFGSAGCNVTYRIDPQFSGVMDPSKTYRVTYEVSGVEDGPAVNNFTVTGNEATFPSEETASTTSTKAKLTAKATDIAEE